MYLYPYYESCILIEISEIGFHPIDNFTVKTYGVLPFIPKLKRWIKQNRSVIQLTMASLDIGLKHKKQNKRSTSAVGNANVTNGGSNKINSYASIVQSNLPKTIANRSSSVIPHSSSNSSSMELSHANAKIKKRVPNTATKVLGFDKRNELTFEAEYSNNNDANAKRWSVDDMFKANAKLTGVCV